MVIFYFAGCDFLSDSGRRELNSFKSESFSKKEIERKKLESLKSLSRDLSFQSNGNLIFDSGILRQMALIEIFPGFTAAELADLAYGDVPKAELNPYGIGGRYFLMALNLEINDISDPDKIGAVNKILFLNAKAMYFSARASKGSLTAKILSGEIVLRSVRVYYSESVESGGLLKVKTLTLRCEIENRIEDPMELKIERGRVFEPDQFDQNYQNLIAHEDVKLSLNPFELKEIDIPVLCINKHKKGPPEGAAYNLTVFIGDAYFQQIFEYENKQQALWGAVESLAGWRSAHWER